MKKKRSDSKLFNLPENQQAELADWLLSGMPYHKARERIALPPPDGFGFVVSSLSPFTPFWEEVCVPALLARRRKAAATANEFAEETKKTFGEFDSATVEALKQKAFELAISPQADPRDVKALYMLVLKSRDQALDLEQLRLDREKFEFDAARACLSKLPELKVIGADDSLDEDAKIRAVRERIFGRLPEESQMADLK